MNKQGQGPLSSPETSLAPVAAPAPQPAIIKQPYTAYQLSQKTKRFLQLRVKFPDPAEYFSNAAITNLHDEWRYGTGFTVVYGATRVVTIYGERLYRLAQAITDWKVEYLTEFDPDFYLRPTDDTAPFIRRIEITTERPEPLPPLQQRH